ncbi:hypothetical protein TRFO_08092 [Tritrichomonas foetus]|uniref:Chromo domain-containing protein n=1 Tax=Tritrichomonas foetus TaxID=1144522 RepID=A0A1J4JNX8_9EUKA|nr:hypothetical protein TRFO_08092 [Tritrichomonas foetus]|eukprot:OHT00112.1 hypothetical protein TRFO_08092 [Tritrichomonas foetus]
MYYKPFINAFFSSFLCRFHITFQINIKMEEEEDSGEIYEVEKILDCAKVDGEMQYLVKWAGYDDPKDLTWEPIEHLQNCNQALQEFYEKFNDSLHLLDQEKTPKRSKKNSKSKEKSPSKKQKKETKESPKKNLLQTVLNQNLQSPTKPSPKKDKKDSQKKSSKSTQKTINDFMFSFVDKEGTKQKKSEILLNISDLSYSQIQNHSRLIIKKPNLDTEKDSDIDSKWFSIPPSDYKPQTSIFINRIFSEGGISLVELKDENDNLFVYDYQFIAALFPDAVLSYFEHVVVLN